MMIAYVTANETAGGRSTDNISAATITFTTVNSSNAKDNLYQYKE
jgi:hypothetical protein